MAQESVRKLDNSKIEADTNEKRRILFVGGLPSSVDEEILRDYFSKLTSVTNLKIARDKKSKGSKGYAYVTLAESCVIPTIVGTHHHLHGRKLDVQVASRKGERHVWKNEQRKRRLFLIDLPCEVTTQEFEQAFSRFGELHNAYTVVESGDSEANRYGYVEFEQPESAERALNAKVYIRGKLIQISKFRNKEQTSDLDIGNQPIQIGKSSQNKIQVLEPKGSSINLLKNSGSRTSIGTKSELKLSGVGSPRERVGMNAGGTSSLPASDSQILPRTEIAATPDSAFGTKSNRPESSYRMGFILLHKLNQNPSNYRLNVQAGPRTTQNPGLLVLVPAGGSLQRTAAQKPSKPLPSFELFPTPNKSVQSVMQPRLSAAIGRPAASLMA